MTDNLYPDLLTAKKIWEEGFNRRCLNTVFKAREEYVFHTIGIAEMARKIALRTGYLNPEKAYVLGLLHDYGKKYDERSEGIFHVRAGYEEMMRLGYSDVARICLTHSFPSPDFDDKDYTSYKQEWLTWAHDCLKDVVYDDYDRLIQFCDIHFEALNIVSIDERIKGICRRYGLKIEQLKNLRDNAFRLKAYFDKKCGGDVYELLNIPVVK